MLTLFLLADLPTQPLYQEQWGETEPMLYMLLGIGFLLTFIVAGAFIYIMTRKDD